jgi:Bacterial regulatory proteins, luxR family
LHPITGDSDTEWTPRIGAGEADSDSSSVNWVYRPRADFRHEEAGTVARPGGIGLAPEPRSKEARHVAKTLFLSPKTVERHVTNALRKVGARNRTELAALLADEGGGGEGEGFPR